MGKQRQGQQDPTEDPNTDGQGKDGAGTDDSKGGGPEPITLTFATEDAKQAWLDKQIGPRLRREREAAQEAEKEKQRKAREKLEEDGARKAAELEGKWENYAETLRNQLDEARNRITELEGTSESASNVTEQLQEHAEVLENLLAPDLERIPEHYRSMPGFEESSMVSKARWIAANRDKLEPAQAAEGSGEGDEPEHRKPGGVPPVHRAGRGSGGSGTPERKEAEKQDQEFLSTTQNTRMRQV